MTYGNSSVYSTFESAENVENFHSSVGSKKEQWVVEQECSTKL